MRSYRTKLSIVLVSDGKLVAFFEKDVVMTVEGCCLHADGSFKLGSLAIYIEDEGCLRTVTPDGKSFVEIFKPQMFSASMHAGGRTS